MISKSNPESSVSSKTKRRRKIVHPMVEVKTLNKVVHYLVGLVSQEGLDISSKRRLMKELRETLRRCHPLLIKKLVHYKSTRKSQQELGNDIPKWHLAGSQKLLTLLPFSTQKTVDSRAKKGLNVETPRRKVEAVRTRPSANRESRKEKIRPRLEESTDSDVEFLKTVKQRAPWRLRSDDKMIKLCPGKAKKRGSTDTKGPSRKTDTVKRKRGKEILGKKSSSPPLSVFGAQDQKKKSLVNSESRRGIGLGTDPGNLTDDSEAPSSEVVFLQSVPQYSSKLRASPNYEIFGSLETPYLPLEWLLKGTQKSKKRSLISAETTSSAKLGAKKRDEIMTPKEPKTEHVSSTTATRLFRSAASFSKREKVSELCDEVAALLRGGATTYTASTGGQVALFSGTHTRGQSARVSETHTPEVAVISAGDTTSPVTTGFKESLQEGFQIESSQKVGFLLRGTASERRKTVPAILRKRGEKHSRSRKEEKLSTTQTLHQSLQPRLRCEFCKPRRPVFRDEQELTAHKKTSHRFACFKCKIEFTDSLKSFFHWKINHVTKFQLGEKDKTGVPPRYVTLETERTAKDFAALNLEESRNVPFAVLEKPGGSADRGCSSGAVDRILITDNVVMSHITANKGAVAATTVEFTPRTWETEIPSGPVEDLQKDLGDFEEVLRDEGFHGSDASMEHIEMDVAPTSKSKTIERSGSNLGKKNPHDGGDELGNILEGVLEFLEESSYPFLET